MKKIKVPLVAVFLFFFCEVAISQIIYTDVIPDAHIQPYGDSLGSHLTGVPYALDLNNDGITDYNFRGDKAQTSYDFFFQLRLIPENGNEIYNAKLQFDTLIWSSLNWSSQESYLANIYTAPGSSFRQGYWINDNLDGYIGLKFTSLGNTYFGWVHLNRQFYVLDYAYEISGGSINAGVTMSSINENTQKNSFIVYPNPSSGKFSIVAPENIAESFRFSIYNVFGEMIGQYYFDNLIDEKNLNLDITDFPCGVYFLVSDIDGLKKVQKIVRQ